MKPSQNTTSGSGPAAQGGQTAKWPATARSSGAGQIGAGGSALPDSLRSSMEAKFGTDFSDVKILNNSCLPQSVGAQAYTSGSHIHFSSGSYQPHTSAGQKLLAHELSHVVQQKAGVQQSE